MTIVIVSHIHVLPLMSSSMTKRISLTLRRSYTLLARHPIIPLLNKVLGKAVSPPVTGDAAHVWHLKLHVTDKFQSKLVSALYQGYVTRMHSKECIGGEGCI